MRGASRVVSLADAEILFRYSDASVLVVLDAIDDIDAVRSTWATVIDRVRLGKRSEALAAMGSYRATNRNPNYEHRQLLDFAQQVITVGDPTRVRMFGFSAADIIECLPSTAFGLDRDWAELRRQFDTESLNKQDFKTWLRLRHNAEISVSTIEQALTSLDRPIRKESSRSRRTSPPDE